MLFPLGHEPNLCIRASRRLVLLSKGRNCNSVQEILEFIIVTLYVELAYLIKYLASSSAACVDVWKSLQCSFSLPEFIHTGI